MDTGGGSAGAPLFLHPFPGSTGADSSSDLPGGRLASLLANAGFRRGLAGAEKLGIWANQTRRFIIGN